MFSVTPIFFCPLHQIAQNTLGVNTFLTALIMFLTPQAQNSLARSNVQKCVVCTQPITSMVCLFVSNKCPLSSNTLYFHPSPPQILKANGRCYHPACFTCVSCDKCLDGVPFTVDARAGRVFCIECYHRCVLHTHTHTHT